MPYVEHLSFQYSPEHIVFLNWDAQIPEGKLTAIIGPSGCGKTTLLNLIAGFLKPSKGRIVDIPQRISYVFQEPRLFPWLTAMENITTVVNDRKRAEQYLHAMNLPPSSFDQYPGELSGGMKQRISIARALIWQPDLILMDEPFHGLDQSTKEATAHLLEQEWKSKTRILITHDPNDLASCDHIIDLSSK